MTEKIDVTFHYDPGHGWYQVPLEMLYRLKLVTKISEYSYCDEKYVYLEEAQDISFFIAALDKAKLRGEDIEINMLPPINHDHHDNPIRKLPRYKMIKFKELKEKGYIDDTTTK